MKKILYCFSVILVSAAYSLAQEPGPEDFKLLPSVNLVKQSKPPEIMIDEIKIKLDNIQKQIDALSIKCGVTQTSDPFANPNKAAVPTVRVQPQPQVQQYKKFVEQKGSYPAIAPATDGGPSWRYDPTTRSYFRYVPTTTRRTIQQPTSPVYPTFVPTPTYQQSYSVPYRYGVGDISCPT